MTLNDVQCVLLTFQGYGLTGPSLSNDSRCLSTSVLAAIEAFLGVLYAGVAGAIMTGKIMRYNAVASVLFSDPMVLRYGAGVEVTDQKGKSNDSDGTDNNSKDKGENQCDDNSPIPYPILEFRVANEAFARDGGEIANAKVQGTCTESEGRFCVAIWAPDSH